MITRIVCLEFEKEYVDTFLSHFDDIKLQINSFSGCIGMKMMQDQSIPGLFFTYSIWKSTEDLENYRKSQLFQSTWNVIKPYFKAKPAAWTLKEQFDGFTSTQGI